MTQMQTQQLGETGYQADGPPDELGMLLAQELAAPPSPVVEALTRAEMEMQIRTARGSPRSVSTFQKKAKEAACLSEAVASSCIYALPRKKDGKDDTIEGPSIRMAEIVAYAWGNVRVESRVVEIGTDSIVARGSCIDLESNNGQSVEVRVSIRKKNGARYDESMIGVAAMSAISKARRNAIFAVIPRAFIIPVMEEVRKTIVGDATTLGKRRDVMLAEFLKMGVPNAKVFAAVKVSGIEDITLDNLATLRGYYTAIKTGEAKIEDIFDAAPAGKSANESIAALREKNGHQNGAAKTETPQQGVATAGAAQAAAVTNTPTTPTVAAEQPSSVKQEPPEASKEDQANFLASLNTPSTTRRRGKTIEDPPFMTGPE